MTGEKSERGYYHIIKRGNNKKAVFEKEENKEKLTEIIARTKKEDNIIENQYNGEGIRTARIVNSVLTRYLYEGTDVVLELDSSGNQMARNVWGTSIRV